MKRCCICQARRVVGGIFCLQCVLLYRAKAFRPRQYRDEMPVRELLEWVAKRARRFGAKDARARNPGFFKGGRARHKGKRARRTKT